MIRLGWAVLLAAVLAQVPVGAVGSTVDEGQSPWVWNDVRRVVAIGDVHGSYDELLELLRGLDLVGPELGWTGGDQHLVMVGDLLDRGVGDRPILDLLMRLEGEAAAAGGRVHVVLGNHEVMNLVRDLRYVAPETYADFREFELPEDRKAYRSLYLVRHRLSGMNQAEVGAAFQGTFPPGYFGRLRAFARDGVYGSWLLERPAAIRIDGRVFVHGGLTEEVAALGIDEINRRITADLEAWLATREILERSYEGPPPSRDELEGWAEEVVSRGGNRPEADAARRLLELSESLPVRADGPFWYRGLSLENERLARDSVDRTLESVNARAMVVGHTPTGSGSITSRFQGRLYRADVGMVYGRQPAALVLDPGIVRVFDPQTLQLGLPLAEAPQGEGWARKYEELPDRKLERFLARAAITECDEIRIEDRSGEVCELQHRGLHLRGVFLDDLEPPEPFRGGSVARRYQHEVAAYRLDRMLGLELVPVTVLRRKEGVEGSLRIFVEPALDLEWLETHGRMDLLEGLELRVGEARLLNALLDSDDRLDVAKMFIPVERRILFGDHSKSFPVAAGLPPGFSDEACAALDADLELAFRELEAGALTRSMGGLLSGEQIASLLQRRDTVLEVCGQ